MRLTGGGGDYLHIYILVDMDPHVAERPTLELMITVVSTYYSIFLFLLFRVAAGGRGVKGVMITVRINRQDEDQRQEKN